MRKEYALEKIELFNEKYLNNDQKLIAKGIINSIPEGQDVQGYLDFILKRTGLGFKFDISPEIANGWVGIIYEIEKMRINVKEVSAENENKLIIGDNYECLKNLLLTHKEKIDVIYIDPPYNTSSAHTDGNESSKLGGGGVIQDLFIKINLEEMVDWI